MLYEVITNPITPSAPMVSPTPDCEGTMTYTYWYTDCSGNAHDWVYTYTIDRVTPPTEEGGPVATSATVECPDDAVAPALPVVKDVCGNTLNPPVPYITQAPDCEGTIRITSYNVCYTKLLRTQPSMNR